MLIELVGLEVLQKVTERGLWPLKIGCEQEAELQFEWSGNEAELKGTSNNKIGLKKKYFGEVLYFLQNSFKLYKKNRNYLTTSIFGRGYLLFWIVFEGEQKNFLLSTLFIYHVFATFTTAIATTNQDCKSSIYLLFY